MRQWVLSVPFPLRFLFASQPKIMGKALGIVYRTIATHLTRKAGYTKTTAHAGAVTLIQRFGGALNLNIHLMCMDARMPRAHGCAGAAVLPENTYCLIFLTFFRDAINLVSSTVIRGRIHLFFYITGEYSEM
jgi:hypothetical protein